jgi:release factor glutamine methyltransferase
VTTDVHREDEKTRRREDEKLPIVGDLLDALASRLGVAGLPARSEARDLIAAVLDVPRFWPSAHRDREVTDAQRDAIDVAAERLSRGMPLAYAARRAQFRTLSLFVDERVLIPRPETELLVEIVLRATNGGRGVVVDVGTGSGAIALSLAAEGEFSHVVGTDVSAEAVAVATLNRERESGKLEAGRGKCSFRVGSWLSPCGRGEADVVVSNPPYIAWAEAGELPSLVRDWEPPLALFADDGGMAAIRVIVHEAAPVLRPGGLLALEVDTRRAAIAAEFAGSVGAYCDVVVHPDLTGRPRFVLARRVA